MVNFAWEQAQRAVPWVVTQQGRGKETGERPKTDPPPPGVVNKHFPLSGVQVLPSQLELHLSSVSVVHVR